MTCTEKGFLSSERVEIRANATAPLMFPAKLISTSSLNRRLKMGLLSLFIKEYHYIK